MAKSLLVVTSDSAFFEAVRQAVCGISEVAWVEDIAGAQRVLDQGGAKTAVVDVMVSQGRGLLWSQAMARRGIGAVWLVSPHALPDAVRLDLGPVRGILRRDEGGLWLEVLRAGLELAGAPAAAGGSGDPFEDFWKVARWGKRKPTRRTRAPDIFADFWRKARLRPKLL